MMVTGRSGNCDMVKGDLSVLVTYGSGTIQPSLFCLIVACWYTLPSVLKIGCVKIISHMTEVFGVKN